MSSKRGRSASGALLAKVVATGFALGLWVWPASAEAANERECFFAPWQRLGASGGELVRPLPLGLLGLGALSPFAIVPTGADHELRLFAQRELGGRYDLEPASVVAPYVIAGGVLLGYTIGALAGSCGAMRHQAAMLQAMALGFGAVAALKVTLGRDFPNAGRDPSSPDRLEHPEYAERFAPFERFGAWPSGHTAVVTAAAASLGSSATELGFARFVGYPLAAGVAAGMWLGDHHWASDIVSGALFGAAIGSSVGRAFRPGAQPGELGWLFVPQPGGALVLFGGRI